MRHLTYSQPLPRKARKPKGIMARSRAKRRRAEGPVAKAVRAACVERDAYCRICDWENNPSDTHEGDDNDDLPYAESEHSRGPSEWAHLETRARTRNMKPELRHTTAITVMLCQFHHDRLDGRARPRLRIKVLTSRGADGPLHWETA